MSKPLDLRDQAIQAYIDGDDEVTLAFDLLNDLTEPFGSKPDHLCIVGQTRIKGRPICKICGVFMD